MRRTFSFAACLLVLAPASMAWSQQESGTQPARPLTQTESQPRAEGRAQDDQGRPRAGAQQRPDRGGAERGVSQLATLLALGNQAEIELGGLAAQKASNENVREFAQKMVTEHTAYLQKLEQFNPQLAAGNRNRQRLEEAGEQTRAGRPERQQSPAGRPLAEGAQATEQREGQGGQVALLPILRDAAQRNLTMTKEMLSKYEGQDFDMGYLGQQIVAHTEMLAKLQAMQGKGSPEFQQVVEQGIPATTQHLEMAQTLARQLEDRERGGDRPQANPTTRPGQPSNRPQ